MFARHIDGATQGIPTQGMPTRLLATHQAPHKSFQRAYVLSFLGMSTRLLTESQLQLQQAISKSLQTSTARLPPARHFNEALTPTGLRQPINMQNRHPHPHTASNYLVSVSKRRRRRHPGSLSLRPRRRRRRRRPLNGVRFSLVLLSGRDGGDACCR